MRTLPIRLAIRDFKLIDEIIVMPIWGGGMEDEALIERLLYQGEGDALDFKLQQYAFEAADNDAKSELLKDIIAFANSWRESAAYILIGVRDNPREVVGIDRDIDDSRLQQFINGKLNKPLRFEYRSVFYGDKALGLYVIHVQARPFYAVKDFGRVMKDTVYVRRGSSTDIAKPDEIAKMGAATSAAHAPRLNVKIVCRRSRREPGDSLQASYTKLQLPDTSEIPDYTSGRMGNLRIADPTENRNYYRQVAPFLSEKSGLVPIQLLVENFGDAYADGVKVTLRVKVSEGFRVMVGSDLMSKPSTTWAGIVPAIMSRSVREPAVTVRIDGDLYVATFTLGKVQAGAAEWTETLYFFHPPEVLDDLDVVVHADQLRGPLTFKIPTAFDVNHAQLSVDQLVDYSNKLDRGE